MVPTKAQNIKNFKSLRWQMLLNFRTERRLLLTGTPLQNSLMELWSLMHFLMPHIFGSHKDFREWFSNPLTGMIEGSQEYNEQTVKRLHKVLRPFLLRRMKSEVEKQLPKKFEHVIVCQLSKRQRFLYEDFMSRGSTKNLLSSGNVMSVMNVLMQLRKVCNHPFLFEPRPIFSPYIVKPIDYKTAGRVVDILEFDILKDLQRHNLPRSENVNRFIYQSLCELSRIDKLTKIVLEEVPSVPVVTDFCLEKFYTGATFGRGYKSDHVTKRLQFVLPTNVAGNMDLRQPFFLQMGTPSGVKFIPIKLDSQITQNVGSRIQRDAITSSSAAYPVDSQSKSNDTSSQTKEPMVLKLIPQNSTQRHQQIMTFQAAPAVQSGVNLLNSNVPKLLNQIWPDSNKHCDLPVIDKKNINQMFPGMAIITSKTHLHPKMTDNANYRTTTTNFVPLIAGTGHKVTVHDIIPRTPTICVFDPKKAQENLEMSKTSVPPKSPPKRSLASVMSIISQHVDAAKPSTSCDMGSAFELTSLKRKKVERMVSNFLRVITENQRRCKETRPVYGENLRRLCCISRSSSLDQFCTRFEQRFESSKPILDRFIMAVPAVKSTSSIALNVTKMLDAKERDQQRLLNRLKQALHPLLNLLEPVASSLAIQFPELRLIEYDCGKLQSLSMLLRRLKIDGHRCLIFTQMARMLDILESFLSYHGHTYLRLDGATHIEHRQILMERFNQDRRIFCFILSTRSGGIGVNLTGADTVIFYDSDWNPTMDAQAQDRCHRIGQTRDVHIYRLISEKTVEENILKKSMQKRKLGEIAIEKGEFTSEFFKKSNIADIFELVNADTSKLPTLSQQELEQVMTGVEDDERDVAAANVARAEAVANMDEFNEESQQPSTSLHAVDAASTIDPDMLKIDQEMKHLMEQLKPVERYAVRYIEAIVEPDRLDEVLQTEREIESHKRKWEQSQETSTVENERKRRRIRDEEFDLTYQLDDSTSQMISLDDESDILPIWYPPTPPPSDLEDSATDFDPYFEPTMGFLYERTPMTESELPPLYVESQIADRSPFKSPKRDEDWSSSRAGDNDISTPQNLTSSSSMTQNPTPQKFADVKRQESRVRTPVSPVQAVRPPSGQQSPQIGQPSTKSITPLTTTAAKQPKPIRRPGTPPVGVTDNESADVVYEWNLLEDYSLFNSVTKVQHAHQSSAIVVNNEGHGINWDLVSECVAASCGRYRSPKQCHRRYEMVILPREEGRSVLVDHPPVVSTKKGRKLDAEIAASKKFRIRTVYQFQNEGQTFMNSFAGQRFRNSTGLRIKRSLLNKRAGYGICRSEAVPRHRGAGWSSLPANFQTNPIDPFKMVELYEERLRIEEKRKQLHQQQLAEQAAASVATRSLTAPGAITIVQQPQQMAGSSTVGLPSGATVIPFQLPIGQQQLQGQQLSFMVNSQGGRLLTRPVQQSTYQQVNQNIIQSNIDSGPFAARPPNQPMPVNIQTTTVYRQMHPQSFKMQQTPPGTPNPVATYQANVSSAAAMANYQTGAGGRTYIEIPASSSGVVVQSAVGGPAQQLTNQQTQVVSQPPLDFTSLIKQQPQQRVAVSGANKQKIQFGNGSFLVSADIPKGSATGGQIATVLPAGTRFSGTPVRTQVQLSTAGPNIQQQNIRRNSPLPRGVGMQPGNGRLSMTPSASVHLISNTGRLMTGSQVNSSVAAPRIQNSPAPYLPPNVTAASQQQTPQPNQSSSTAAANNRNAIPSVSNILPPSAANRAENLPGGPTIIIHHHPYPPSTAP